MAKTFKEICIEYAEAHGCGLPLTAAEFCNALYLWVQEQGESLAGLAEEIKTQVTEVVMAQVGEALDAIDVCAGDNISVTADEKQFTVSMTADDLAGVLKSGDKYVVVDKTEDGRKVEVHIDKALLDLIAKKVDKPTTASSDVRAICAAPNGSTLYFEPEQFKGAFGIESGGGGVYFGRATLGIYSPGPSNSANEIRVETNLQINGIFAQQSGSSVVRLRMSTQDESYGTRRFFTPYEGANPLGAQVIRLWRDSAVSARDAGGNTIATGLVMFNDLTPYYLAVNLGGEGNDSTMYLITRTSQAYMPSTGTAVVQDTFMPPIALNLPEPVVVDGTREYYLTVTWSV